MTRVHGLKVHATQAHAVTHEITLDVETVREVAARHRGPTEAHAAGLPLVHASGRRRSRTGPPGTTIAELADNDSWVTLFGVTDDKAIRPITAALSAELAAESGPEPDLVVSLICSSAFGVTPAHMDTRDVLLLQVVGDKSFGTGAIPDRAERDAELRRRFGPGRENLRRLPDVRSIWPLRPGDGVFVPAYTPHWAHVGDDVSIAISVAVGSVELSRREAIHQADAALVKRHLRLPAPGRSRVVDEARLRSVEAGRLLARRAAARRR